MKIFKLNSKQMVKLIKNKRIFITQNETIELYDEEIILNNKGNISKLEKSYFEFPETNKTENFLHSLVCDYFNCNPHEVICTGISIQEATFRIRLIPQKELGIIVVTSIIAQKNMKNITEDVNSDEITSKNQIGLYHRLGNTEYFFRWDENFI